MKIVIGFLLTVSLFFFVSCSKDTITSPLLNKASGTVSLQIDKTNAPQNVVNIVAYLSRVGYDTLTGNLNLQSNSSADKQKEIPDCVNQKNGRSCGDSCTCHSKPRYKKHICNNCN